MKRIMTIVAALMLMVVGMRGEQIFKDIKPGPGVDKTYISGALLRLGGSSISGYTGIAGLKYEKLESVEVLSIDPPADWHKAVDILQKYLANNKLELMLEKSDGDDMTKIWALPGADDTLSVLIIGHTGPQELNIVVVKGTLSGLNINSW